MRWSWRYLAVMVGLAVWVGAALGAPTQPAPAVSFNLIVSIEWQPGSNDSLPDDLAASNCPAGGQKQFTADLEVALRQMAAYFYSYTNGQMAINTVDIYTDGANWDKANIRILANQSYRPTAFVGGITPDALLYTAPGSKSLTAIFDQAPIFLGRFWNGNTARCGAWSEPAGWRTIGHEWGHNALFLYDEYLNQSTGQPQYCNSDDPRFHLLNGAPASAVFSSTVQSLMAYHYTADQLSWWKDGDVPPPCLDTPQWNVHGASDWATVERFYGPTGIYTAAGVVAPPELMPGPVFDQTSLTVNDLSAPAPEHTSASVEVEPVDIAPLVGQSYLIRTDPIGNANYPDAPVRIIGEGNIITGAGNSARFVGVDTAQHDRAAIQIQNYTTGEQFGYPYDYRAITETLVTTTTNNLQAQPSDWRPALAIEPLVLLTDPAVPAEVTGLHVTIATCGGKQPEVVEVVYCPAGGRCGFPEQATPTDPDVFEHTFRFDPSNPVALHGYIYARAPELGWETMTWYQLAGGVGPAHTGGFAPLADSSISVELPQNTPADPQVDNRVLLTPAPQCAQTGLPARTLRLVDSPLYVQNIIGDPNNGQPWSRGDPPLRVRVGYDEDLLLRLGINEHWLVLLHRNLDGAWEVAKTSEQNDELNWLVAAPQHFLGEGEVYALAYQLPPYHISVPLLLNATP